MQIAKSLTALGMSALLAACGGGGGGAPETNTVDQISNVTLNPAAAVQSLFTTTRNVSGIQYSAGTPEIFNGVTYQVQNILSIDSNGNSSASKRYYSLNPFAIYTPEYSYSYAVNYLMNYYYVSRTPGVLPTSAKVGDFGLYETATVEVAGGSRGTTQETSAWTLTKYTNTTALFCYGALNSQNLTYKTCYKLNARGEIV